MTTKQRVVIFVLAGLGGVAAIGATVAMMMIAMKGTQYKQASGDDRKLVVTADDLVQFGGPAPGEDDRAVHTLRQYDGSRVITYHFSGEGRPTLMSQTHVLPHTLGAIQMFKMLQLGLKAESKFGKQRRLVDAPRLLEAGDQHYAAVVYDADGAALGNYFLVRQGRVVHSVDLTGIQLETRDEVNRLLSPMLEESKRQFAKR